MRSAILLSGGLDSTALAYWLRPKLAITFDYGQVAASSELRAARAISRNLGIGFREVTIDIRKFGAGPMAGLAPSPLASNPEWWPFRNQILITLAAGIAIQEKLDELLIGTVRSDSEYADGSEQFYNLIDNLIQMQEGHLRVRAPAIRLSTIELIKLAGVPRSLLAWSYSCSTSQTPCQKCRSCLKQIQALAATDFF